MSFLCFKISKIFINVGNVFIKKKLMISIKHMPCQRVATWHTPKTMTIFVVKNDIPMFKEFQVK